MNGGGRKPASDEAEVDALLLAAQDAVLLKLQANSHLVSSSSSSSSAAPLDPLDDDLARRFHALKSRPPKLPAAGSAASGGGVAEMEARFAALTGGAAGPEKEEPRVRLEDLGGESDEEDEVEKVMRWAMDAARLDVATTSTTTAGADEKDDRSSVSSEEEDDGEGLESERKRKEMVIKNKPKSKWFFF